MCKACEIARSLGGKYCRPCWRKLNKNKKSSKGNKQTTSK